MEKTLYRGIKSLERKLGCHITDDVGLGLSRCFIFSSKFPFSA